MGPHAPMIAAQDQIPCSPARGIMSGSKETPMRISSSSKLFRAFLLAAAASCGFSHGVTLTLSGVTQSSSTIRNDGTNINLNFGAYEQLIVGTTTAPAVIRTVFGFSLASIPAGSTITSISLALRQVGPDNGASPDAPVTLELHQLTTGFTEGSGTGSGSNNGAVSWNSGGAASTGWVPGGPFNATNLSTVTANPKGAAGTIVTFNSTSDFVLAAQNSIGGDLSMIMKLATEDTAVRRALFFVSDNGAVGATPTLTIEYTIPEPSTSMLAVIAGGALALRRRRR